MTGAPLTSLTLQLEALGSENQKIGEALLLSAIGQVWGRDLGRAIRDLAIELVRNSFAHGGATQFQVVIEPHRVVLRDDGAEFKCHDIFRMKRQSGGGSAVRSMLDHYSERVVLASRRDDDWNETVVALVQRPADISKVTPCALEFHSMELHEDGFSIPLLSDCDVTYIVMPCFISYSDAGKIVWHLSSQDAQTRKYVIATPDISDGVAQILKDGLPNCTVMRF